jgi:hypothetical protein
MVDNTCYLCGHKLEKHRIIKFTPTHLSISCGDITATNLVSAECGCNGGFTTTVSIKLEETK